MGEIEKKILTNILDEISTIADLEYQYRVWIKGIGPDCHFYDDVICNFFGPANHVISNYPLYGISKKQNDCLIFFYTIFESFNNAQLGEPFEFIATPGWQQVVDEAKKVLEAFNYIKPDVQDLL
jgi:hypothetical protein